MKIALRDFENKTIGKIKKGTKFTKDQIGQLTVEDVESLEAAKFIGEEKKTTPKKVDKK